MVVQEVVERNSPRKVLKPDRMIQPKGRSHTGPAFLSEAEGQFGLPIAFKGLAGLTPLTLVTDGNMLFGIPLVAGTDNIRGCVM